MVKISFKKILDLLEKPYPNGLVFYSLKSIINEEDEILEFDISSLKDNSLVRESGKGKMRIISLTEKGMDYVRKMREKEDREKQQKILENQTKFNRYLVIISFVIAMSSLANLVKIKEIKYIFIIISAMFLLSIPVEYLIDYLINRINKYKGGKKIKKLLKPF